MFVLGSFALSAGVSLVAGFTQAVSF